MRSLAVQAALVLTLGLQLSGAADTKNGLAPPEKLLATRNPNVVGDFPTTGPLLGAPPSQRPATAPDVPAGDMAGLPGANDADKANTDPAVLFPSQTLSEDVPLTGRPSPDANAPTDKPGPESKAPDGAVAGRPGAPSEGAHPEAAAGDPTGTDAGADDAKPVPSDKSAPSEDTSKTAKKHTAPEDDGSGQDPHPKSEIITTEPSTADGQTPSGSSSVMWIAVIASVSAVIFAGILGVVGRTCWRARGHLSEGFPSDAPNDLAPRVISEVGCCTPRSCNATPRRAHLSVEEDIL